MTALAAVIGLRFREALSGRLLLLVPLHFALATAAAAATPGADEEGRRAAADATGLALALVLGAGAAAALGAGPLVADRRPGRGATLLASPVTPWERALGTVLGAGGALTLLVAGTLASAMGATVVGTGGGAPLPEARTRAASVEGGVADATRPEVRWTAAGAPPLDVTFPDAAREPTSVALAADVRAGRDTGPSGTIRIRVRAGREPGAPDGVWRDATAPWRRPFRVPLPAGARYVRVERVAGGFDVGIAAHHCARVDGPRPRALARGLHAAALASGLLALLAATAALSTVTGAGVAAAGGVTLLLLAASGPSLREAAAALDHAGAVERALGDATGETGAGDRGPARPRPSAVPPAAAPVFRAVARALPDVARFDLSGEVVAGHVPDPGDVAAAAATGLGMAAGFTLLAGLGAARRP